jgi:chromosomal replication initiation ATPase DnaA
MNINYIIKSVCDKWNITEEELKGGRRIDLYVRARADVVKILRDEMHLSFASIAQLLNKKDHSTAIHLYKKGNDLST